MTAVEGELVLSAPMHWSQLCVVPVALRAVAPHRLPDPRRRYTRANSIDDSSAIAVRDDAGNGIPTPKTSWRFFTWPGLMPEA